jgi:rhodanese-related sulfurtransferase
MADRIDADQAHEKLKSHPETLLVCAYDSEEKFRENHLEGAISLEEFKTMADHLPFNREVIFYCACLDEASSAGQADDYRKKGFVNAKALKGGVDAWDDAGYGILSPHSS